MKRANYHTHTPRCGHAWGTEREYAEAAVGAGLEALGFSDHVPQPYRDFTSGIRMGMEELPGYVETLLKLREEYRRDIHIKIGFEVEYVPDLFDELMGIMDAFPVDYFILGQHFLERETPEYYAGRKTEAPERLARYVDLVLEGLSTGRFAYLAHPDIINFAGDRDVYREQMGRLCRECRKRNVPLEINRLGMYEGRNYPSREFFETAAAEGNEVIIGYDAHRPDVFADEETYERCKTFAEELGIRVNEAYRI